MRKIDLDDFNIWVYFYICKNYLRISIILDSTPLHLPQVVPADVTFITFSRVSAPPFIAFSTSLTVKLLNLQACLRISSVAADSSVLSITMVEIFFIG